MRTVEFSVSGLDVTIKGHVPMSAPKVGDVRKEHATLAERMAHGGPLPIKVKVRPTPIPRQPTALITTADPFTEHVPPRARKSSTSEPESTAREVFDSASPRWTAPRAGTSEGLTDNYTNPKLSAVLDGGFKQYLFEGRPVFPPYTHGAPKPEKEAGLPHEEIGRGGSHVVLEKHNPQCTVYRKVPHNDYFSTHLPQVMETGKVMDEAARVLLAHDDETRRMSQHFAVELLKEVRNGQPVFYTRAVDGFTLKKYLKTPRKFPELPIESLGEKARELFAALDWLREKGFFQEDPNLGNVMFDRVSGKLVMIDFASLDRYDPSKKNAYDATVRELRDLLGDHIHD